jgi:hypothetical protein
VSNFEQTAQRVCACFGHRRGIALFGLTNATEHYSVSGLYISPINTFDQPGHLAGLFVAPFQVGAGKSGQYPGGTGPFPSHL